MYKFIGLAMLSIFAMMVIPGNFDTAQNELVLYGMANMVKHDALGNEVFQQTVHNQLTDEGEQYILAAVFANGAEPLADNQSFGAICVSSTVVPSSAGTRESHTALAFDTANALNTNGNLTCEKDNTTNIGITSGVATIGPFQFASGDDNVADGNFIQSMRSRKCD